MNSYGYELPMLAIGSTTGEYAESAWNRISKTWVTADRGWRATTIGGLIAGAVSVGLSIPW